MDNQNENVSYFVLEGMMTHLSLIIKRLVIVLVIILALWAATIGGFLWYLSLPIEEYDTVSVENEDGNANYIGNDMMGDFNYGKSE